MKVTWQADDIKAGLEVGRNIGPSSCKVLYQLVDGVGPRYVLTTEDNGVTQAMSKDDMAAFLTGRGYKPVVVLTL